MKSKKLVAALAASATIIFSWVYAQPNVGIGTSTPIAKLDIIGNIKITDGTQGAGKVLTSNANGLASWRTPDSSKVKAIGTIAATSNINGALITADSLILTPANGSYGGIVTAGDQNFGGTKTFVNPAIINGVKVGQGSVSGRNNIAIGNLALENSSGDHNTALGFAALSKK